MVDGGKHYDSGHCRLIGYDCQGRPEGACGVCRTKADYQARLKEINTEPGLAKLTQ